MLIRAIHPGRVYVPDPETRKDPRYPNAVKSVPVLDGYSTNWGSSGGYPEDERDCIGNRGRVCPHDSAPLVCLDDYIGGGSHYWHLWCPVCSLNFSYDTYGFELREW